MPQRSVLELLLFLVYVDDIRAVMKYSEVHHFADDSNLLTFLSQLLHKYIANRLKANKLVNTVYV